MRALAAAVAVVSLCLPSGADEALDRGRSCYQRFQAGELATLHEGFAAEMQQALSLESLTAFREQTRAQLGAETALVEESADAQGRTSSYRRVARFEKFEGLVEAVFAFDAENKVSGFYVRPVPKEADSDFLEYRTRAELRLPFEGEWFVFWGGRSLAQNQHAATRDQRFAYDILIMQDGQSHTGDGTRNDDYHCFGRPILAPAAGVVVAAAGDLADNAPGQFDRLHPAGNHVVLDLGHGEYALLAHFRQGTLKVAPGDKVEAGALLAECGNSGNSSEPHLHVHLQDGPTPFQAAGLPAQFQRYLADGQPVERGEPLKGQRVQPAPVAAAKAPPAGAAR